MKPLLKWAGGKRHIADKLFAYFPDDWNQGTYYEPFIGGAALFLHIQPSNAVIADFNTKLTNFYSQVKVNAEELFFEISKIALEFNSEISENKRDYFLNLRSRFNEANSNTIESAVLLYVLNKLCFNGLYRENAKGQFNVPFGQKKKFPELAKEDFFNASQLLKSTSIINADFEETLKNAKQGDFVYFDPPYIPVDATSSFTSYHAEGFTQEDQMRLSKLMSELASRGIKAICSNSDTEVTRKIYGQLNQKTVVAPRMVSAKSSGRGMISELVISNF